MAPFNIFDIRWQLLMIIYGIIGLVVRHYTIVSRYIIIIGIYYNAFLFSRISKYFQGTFKH